jgi:hypothetical protein
MNPFKLFRVFSCENTSSVTHNKINQELMPEVEKYWKSKGRFNYKLYDQFIRLRNTEVIKNEKNKSIQVVYSQSDELFELRQGFVSLDGNKTDLREPFVVSLDELEQIYDTVFNLKLKQL